MRTMTRSAFVTGFAALSMLCVGTIAESAPNPATNTRPASTPTAADWKFYDYYPKKVQCVDAGENGKAIGLWNEYECRFVLIGYNLYYR
ncbi:hypothetical protein [Amycolatopsis samaneae]|uniref:Secreted protein n=1 Tax=Amycolatopsis samaneae TaxID=664691 RepID=A0ABW5GWY2_9PSEU